MYPILFKIPVIGLEVPAFGFMVMSGFLFGSFLLGKLSAKYGDDTNRDPERYSQITVWILIGVIIGARAMYVIVEVLRELTADTPSEFSVGRAFLDNPAKMFAVWQGGLVMYGGTFGAILAGMWCARRLKVRTLHALDLGLAAGSFGLAIGRVGCLLVGDDFGSIVPESAKNLPFPITITVPEVLREKSLFGLENAGQVLWATQPWMSINAILLGCLGLWLIPKRRYAGQVSLILAVTYSIGRFTIEEFRGDAIRGVWFDGAVSTSQLVSIVTFTVAVLLLIKNRARSEPFHPDAEDAASEAA